MVAGAGAAKPIMKMSCGVRFIPAVPGRNTPRGWREWGHYCLIYPKNSFIFTRGESAKGGGGGVGRWENGGRESGEEEGGSEGRHSLGAVRVICLKSY